MLPALSIRTLVDPCGLWQVVQSILPSRTGMWPDFLTFIASCLWQVSQVSTAVTVFSCALSDFGLCTLWQVAHDTLRASCMPPSKSACELLRVAGQAGGVDVLARDIAVNRLILVLSPVSTCAWPGPWQVSQLWFAFAAGVRVFCALPCSVRVQRLALRFVAGRAGVVADEAGGLRRRGAGDDRRARGGRGWRRRPGLPVDCPAAARPIASRPDDREHGHQPACRETVTAFQHVQLPVSVPSDSRRTSPDAHPRLQGECPASSHDRLHGELFTTRHTLLQWAETLRRLFDLVAGLAVLADLLPSFDLWLSSWQRKQPGKSMWPMLFG